MNDIIGKPLADHEKVERIHAAFIETEEMLDEALQYMNWEEGHTPVLVGIDAKGMRFLAYGWAPGGDGWQINITTDDTHSGEFDIQGVNRCDECGAFDRIPVSHLEFPLAVI